MSSEPQHGPLPWEATVENGGRVISIRPKGQGWLLATVPLDTFTAQHYSGHDTAALIVRAVNSLQSSIAAMEAALVTCEDYQREYGPDTPDVVAQLRDAIKLAKGEANV